MSRLGAAGAVVLALALCTPALGADELVAGSVATPAGAPAPSPERRPWIALTIQLALAGAAAFAIAKWRLHRPGESCRTPDAREAPPIAPGMFLLATLMLFVINMLGGAAGSAMARSSDDPFQKNVLAMTGLYAGFALGIAVLGALIPGLLRAIGWRAKPSDALAGLLGSALIIPIVVLVGTIGILLASALAQWSGHPPPEPTAHTGLRLFEQSQSVLMRTLFGALVVIGAPIAEETMYRGLIQTGVLRATRAPWMAIFGTSVVFTMMHISAVDWFALPAIFTLSVGLGVAAERTGRLAAPIIIHALFNLLNLVLTVWFAG